jgi:hypothetical protein
MGTFQADGEPANGTREQERRMANSEWRMEPAWDSRLTIRHSPLTIRLTRRFRKEQ